MPTLPKTQIDPFRPRNLPGVISPRIRIGEAAEAFGQGLRDVGDAAALIDRDRRRAAEAGARAEADKAYGDYVASFSQRMRGGVADDGAPVPGWADLDHGSLDTPEGGALKRLSAAQQEWHKSETYAGLSPRARVLFGSKAQAAYTAFGAEAYGIDRRNAAARRKIDNEAALAASHLAADRAPLEDDEAWKRAAARDAADTAVTRLGTEVINPEELYGADGAPDPARLRFQGGEASRALFEAEAAKARQRSEAGRAERMIAAAEAERDLDLQEDFLRAAERFSAESVTDERTRAGVAAAAKRVRAAALREETLAAWDALATGKPYAPEGNARKESAYREVAPKIEARRRAELGRTLTGNKEFIAAMAKAGARPDADGNVTAMTADESREWLRAQLAAGHIRAGDYASVTAGLDRIERSGRKERYERVSAEVSAALGAEIKTLWTDAGAVLSEKEDPARKIGSYTYEERRGEQVPETETVTAYRGGSLFGVPSAQSRPTGRMTERSTAVRVKRELLASDMAKAVNLLMDAESADGIRLDLDGNPLTPDKPFDAREYRVKLLSDIKNRQLAVDLDTQAAVMGDALSRYRRDQRYLEAAAVMKNAALRLPEGRTGPGTEEDPDAD